MLIDCKNCKLKKIIGAKVRILLDSASSWKVIFLDNQNIFFIQFYN